MPSVGRVVIERQQPQEGSAVLGFWGDQQLGSHLYPVDTLNQQEPGFKHPVVPPKRQENM